MPVLDSALSGRHIPHSKFCNSKLSKLKRQRTVFENEKLKRLQWFRSVDIDSSRVTLESRVVRLHSQSSLFPRASRSTYNWNAQSMKIQSNRLSFNPLSAFSNNYPLGCWRLEVAWKRLGTGLTSLVSHESSLIQPCLVRLNENHLKTTPQSLDHESKTIS